MFGIPHSSDYAIAKATTGTVYVGTASGDNTVIATPGAGSALAFTYLKAQRTAGDTGTTTVLFKGGTAGATFHPCILDSTLPGEVCIYAESEMQIQFLPANTPLIANFSAANSVTITAKYLVVEA
jgi:hypothetical protein